MNGAITYWGYCDPSKRPAQLRLQDAMRVYRQRFGADPDVVLVSSEIAADLNSGGVAIEARHHVAPHTFLMQRPQEALS